MQKTQAQPEPAGTPDKVQAPAPALQAPPDPIAGGNYVRDPLTGALSPNPAHPANTTPQE